MLDFKELTPHIIHREAKERFIKHFEVYAYFSPQDKNIDDGKLFRFSPLFTFEKNYQIIEQRFKFITGKIQLFTRKTKYLQEEIDPRLRHKQQTMNF